MGTLDPLLTIALFTIVWVAPESRTIAIFGLKVVVADDLKGHLRSFDVILNHLGSLEVELTDLKSIRKSIHFVFSHMTMQNRKSPRHK